MFFPIFENGKSFFQAIKTTSSKSRKIDIFPKGLTHGFGHKMAIFTTFFFQAIKARKMFFSDVRKRKIVFLGYKNKKFKKSKNCYFSKRVNPGFWSKNGHVSNFFFQPIQARKMSFTIFQNGKTPFQAIKTISSKSKKIDIFLKGLTHSFGPKMAIFPNVFFRQYRPGKCVLRYSRKKNRRSRL